MPFTILELLDIKNVYKPPGDFRIPFSHGRCRRRWKSTTKFRKWTELVGFEPTIQEKTSRAISIGDSSLLFSIYTNYFYCFSWQRNADDRIRTWSSFDTWYKIIRCFLHTTSAWIASQVVRRSKILAMHFFKSFYGRFKADSCFPQWKIPAAPALSFAAVFIIAHL